MKTVLFLGSKPIGYQCLKFLLDVGESFGATVVGVLSNDNPRFDKALSVRALANDRGVAFIERLDDILEMERVDLLVSVQYHLILEPRHIDVARSLAINLHMAPLPEYRGCNQFSFAIYDDAREFGTTLHRLECGIDDGAIIFERRFPIEPGDEVKDLYDKTVVESLKLFKVGFPRIVAGDFTLTPQSELVEQRGSSLNYRKDIQKLKKIDFDESADFITRKVRATAMPGFEPPYAVVDGKKYYVIPESMYDKA